MSSISDKRTEEIPRNSRKLYFSLHCVRKEQKLDKWNNSCKICISFQPMT